MLGAIQNYYL